MTSTRPPDDGLHVNVHPPPKGILRNHHRQEPSTSSTTNAAINDNNSNTNDHPAPRRQSSSGRGQLGLGVTMTTTAAAAEDDEEDSEDRRTRTTSVAEAAPVVVQPDVPQVDRFGFMGGAGGGTNEQDIDHVPPEVIRSRELKWLKMLSSWNHTMKHDFKTVRSRCRKGIPRSVRGRAWFYLCGASYLQRSNPNTYAELLRQDGNPQCIEDIRKDVHRQFPLHEYFSQPGGHGQEDLFAVLKAYSNLNIDDGYCQAHAPIAATLLLHMPAEDSFWCMVAICGKYLKGYYSPGMQALKLDGDILFGLLKHVAPGVRRHLKRQELDPVLYMTEWFLCAFTRTLPWPTVLRVWDMFLCEGIKVLFRTALVLLKYSLGPPGVLKGCPSMYETLAVLKQIPEYVTREEFLVHQIQRLPVTDDQMRKEHHRQLLKRRAAEKRAAASSVGPAIGPSTSSRQTQV